MTMLVHKDFSKVCSTMAEAADRRHSKRAGDVLERSPQHRAAVDIKGGDVALRTWG
jgi:hypothetical protein